MPRLFHAIALSLLLAIAAPVSAEYLVLNDGSVIETQGPWEVDGRRVVYTTTSGVRSMIRLTNVDIEASLTHTGSPNEIEVPEHHAPLTVQFDVDVVKLSHREETDPRLGNVLYEESGMVKIGRLARDMGIHIPETGPDPTSVKRARELVKRYLHRVLAATARYDLNSPGATHDASSDIDKIAKDAGRLAEIEHSQFLRDQVHEIETALSNLARLADQDPESFKGKMSPHLGVPGEESVR